MIPSLYDIVTRQAVLIEGLKLDRNQQFAGAIVGLKDEIRAQLSRLKVRNMGDLTKAELTYLLAGLIKEQTAFYAKFVDQLTYWLDDFTNANMMVNKRMFASYEHWKQFPDDKEVYTKDEANGFYLGMADHSDNKPLFGWASVTPAASFTVIGSKIRNAPSPANGMTIGQFLSTFSTSAQASVVNGLRASYANGDSVSDALDGIVGTLTTPGILDRVTNQARAVTNTVIQQAAATSNAAVQSATYAEYRWDSVMDSRTSEICASRNRNVYRYGEGPLPPAHINCRSHITPLDETDSGDNGPQSFYNWASVQPIAFLREVYDNDAAESLASGMARKSAYDTYVAVQALTIHQFSDSVDLILST